jgi:hypothetical protein
MLHLDIHTSKNIDIEHPKASRTTERPLDPSARTPELCEEPPATNEIATRPRQAVFFNDDSIDAALFDHSFALASERKGYTPASTKPAPAFANCGFGYRQLCPHQLEGN